MSEHETPTRGSEPEGTDKQANGAPDALRRKFAKAALSAPVILTFGPRAVLGQDGGGPCGSMLISVQAAASHPAFDAVVQACDDCLDRYQNCGLDADTAAAYCETSEFSEDNCPKNRNCTPGSELEGRSKWMSRSEQRSSGRLDTTPDAFNLDTSQDCPPDVTATLEGTDAPQQPTTRSRMSRRELEERLRRR